MTRGRAAVSAAPPDLPAVEPLTLSRSDKSGRVELDEAGLTASRTGSVSDNHSAAVRGTLGQNAGKLRWSFKLLVPDFSRKALCLGMGTAACPLDAPASQGMNASPGAVCAVFADTGADPVIRVNGLYAGEMRNSRFAPGDHLDCFADFDERVFFARKRGGPSSWSAAIPFSVGDYFPMASATNLDGPFIKAVFADDGSSGWPDDAVWWGA